MLYPIPRTLVLALGLFVALPAGAVNWRWLEYSPVESFSEEDWEMLQLNARKALDELEDGEAAEWENPATGNSGSAEPLTSEATAGGRCRMLRINNRSAQAEGSMRLRLCRQADGSWRISKSRNGAAAMPQELLQN